MEKWFNFAIYNGQYAILKLRIAIVLAAKFCQLHIAYFKRKINKDY